MMYHFTAVIKRFKDKGEKSGWSYIEVPASIAQKMKPGNKKSFRVKGKLDEYSFEGLSLLPMGGGEFILALNASIRKEIKKQPGAIVQVQMNADYVAYQLNTDLMQCLADDPGASAYFYSLPLSHRNYYSKWIDSAKTGDTKSRRIAIVVNGLAEGLDFGTMMRKARDQWRPTRR